MANNRKFKRYIKRCEVEFESHGKWFKGITSDFSFSGLFIRTRHPLPPNTKINLRLHLPDEKVSEVKGRVMRATMEDMGRVLGTSIKARGKDGMGIEIADKDSNYLDFLRAVLGEQGDNPSECCVTEESLSSIGTKTFPKEETQEDDIAHLRHLVSETIICQEALIGMLEKKGLLDREELRKEMEKLRKTSRRSILNRVFFI